MKAAFVAAAAAGSRWRASTRTVPSRVRATDYAVSPRATRARGRRSFIRSVVRKRTRLLQLLNQSHPPPSVTFDEFSSKKKRKTVYVISIIWRFLMVVYAGTGCCGGLCVKCRFWRPDHMTGMMGD